MGCRPEAGRYVVPSLSIICDVLLRVDPAVLDYALQQWNNAFAPKDSSIAVDGKTKCNAIDKKSGKQTLEIAVGLTSQASD